MRYLYLSLLLFLYASGIQAQNVHFKESFDGSSGKTPPSGWTVKEVSGDTATDSWYFENPGDRHFGQSISGWPYATFDDDYNSGDGVPDTVDLISPTIDLTGKVNTSMLFYDYMEGGFGGKGQVYVRKNNSGATWQKVYEIDSTSFSNPNKIGKDLESILSQSGSNGTFQVRFRWIGNDSFWWIVDDLYIYSSVQDDASGLKVSNLPQSCVISLTSPIDFTIKNVGTNQLSSVAVNYKLNGDSVVSDTLSFPNGLNQGNTYTYVFDSAKAPTFKEGSNSIKLWTSNPNGNPDAFPANDTVFETTSLQKLKVTNLPVNENFEDNLGVSWCKRLSTSGNGRIRRLNDSVLTACGGNHMLAMDAEASSIDMLDLLVNLESCVDKTLEFTYGNVNDNKDPEDGLFISVDNGGTFHKIMDFDMAASHDSCVHVSLNLDSVASSLGISLSSTSMLRWKHAGNNTIESGNDGFYVDDVSIDFNALNQVDAEMVEMTKPQSISEGDTTQVQVRFSNNSADTMVSANISYQLNDGSINQEFWGGCLGQNDTATFTFSKEAIPSSSDSILCAWISQPNNMEDMNHDNDSICKGKVVSGLDDFAHNNGNMNFSLFPNPATAKFNVAFETNKAGKVTHVIYDVVGNQVYQSKTYKGAGKHKAVIKTDNLAPGIYIYKIKFNDSVISRRVSVR